MTLFFGMRSILYFFKLSAGCHFSSFNNFFLFLFSSDCPASHHWVHAQQRRWSNWCLGLYTKRKKGLSQKVRFDQIILFVTDIVTDILSDL